MHHRSPLEQDVKLLVQSRLYYQKHYDLCHQEALVSLSKVRKRARLGQLNDLEAPFIQKKSLKKQGGEQKIKNIFILGNKKDTDFLRPLASITQSWVPVERAWPTLFFLQNIDPRTFWESISLSDLESTLFFFLSSTGESPESAIPLMRCVEYWKNDIDALRNALTIIAPQKEGILKTISHEFSFDHKEYPSSFLGCHHYFSDTMLSLVERTGFCSESFKKGAALVCAEFFRGTLAIPVEYVALTLLAQKAHSITRHIHKSHLFDFHHVAQWMNHTHTETAPWIFKTELLPQKQNCRTFYTLFMEKNITKEPISPELWQNNALLTELSKNPLLGWVYKNHDAMCRDMMAKGHFLRTLYVDKMNEKALGALFMNHILENLMMQEAFGA